MTRREDDITTAERRQVLDRDDWQCTSGVRHRLSGRVARCPIMGSEMVVVDGRAQCPAHARGDWPDAFKSSDEVCGKISEDTKLPCLLDKGHEGECRDHTLLNPRDPGIPEETARRVR